MASFIVDTPQPNSTVTQSTVNQLTSISTSKNLSNFQLLDGGLSTPHITSQPTRPRQATSSSADFQPSVENSTNFQPTILLNLEKSHDLQQTTAEQINVKAVKHSTNFQPTINPK